MNRVSPRSQSFGSRLVYQRPEEPLSGKVLKSFLSGLVRGGRRCTAFVVYTLEGGCVRRECLNLAGLLIAGIPLFSQTPIVMASGNLQKCLGITPGSDRMMKTPGAQPYCKQLPGANLYDQAGARFQAGDHVGAAQIVARAAEAGNALAQLRIALMYDQGDGVRQSSKTAFMWYNRAAALGEPESQNQMGIAYETGLGVKEDWDLALKFYKASAMQGWHKGQVGFGRCYQFGTPSRRAASRRSHGSRGLPLKATGRASIGRNGSAVRPTISDSGMGVEHDIVMAGKLRFRGRSCWEAIRPALHSTARRNARSGSWDSETGPTHRKRKTMRRIAKRRYDDCKRAGRDNCY